ncbi:hypothetical protein OIO90_001658 [Microbotryomycetes sp. JL221]|nr:hypothetical protein OIO90_001658 [Microbotryomycetes sp. JL221]
MVASTSASGPPTSLHGSSTPTNTTTSSVSPTLFSPQSAESMASIAMTIASNLGPKSPLRAESPMDDENELGLLQMHEDALRRGPPASDTPGGDCKNLCVRHQRMANGGTNLMLQKSIENLSPHEQQAVNTVWSLFSASPARRRLLILQGLLTIACPSQLSFLQDALTLEMRTDPVEILPREVCLKIFGYLDAISLGRAAQVSKGWKSMADDDLLWRTMCEQHIERKCEKCGWGLPLLGERRRKAKGMISNLAQRMSTTTSTNHNNRSASPVTPGVHTPVELTSSLVSLPPTPAPMSPDHTMATSDADGIDQHRTKRAKTHSPGPSSPRMSTMSSAQSTGLIPARRPWKLVYCERLAIERNWRRGDCVATVLSGHTDAITCLQVAEDLPHPSFPVLMTGSWDRTVRIWNLESGKEVGVLVGHSRGIRALQFDALKLVTGSMDSTLKIWNWRTGECLRTLRGHRDAVICLTYDKQLLVSGSGDSTIRVWDFGTGEVQVLRGHTEWVNSVALWDSNAECGPGGDNGSALKAFGEGDLGAPTTNPEAARASSKGKFLFSASDDSTIRVWDLYTRQCVRVLNGHVAQVQSLRIALTEIAPPRFPAASLVSQAPPRVTRSTSSTSATSEHVDDNNEVARSAASPWLATSRSIANETAGHGSTDLPVLDFAGTKRPLVVSASLDNTIKVWDVESAQCQRTMFGHIEGVWDVDVDNLRIVSASHDRTLKIWERDTGKCLHTLVGHTGAVTSVVLQDQYCVTGGDDGNIRIWNFAPRSSASIVESV